MLDKNSRDLINRDREGREFSRPKFFENRERRDREKQLSSEKLSRTRFFPKKC